MYITTIRKRLISNGVLGGIGKVVIPWIHQTRNLQVIYNNVSTDGVQKKLVKYENAANLKFDPTDNVTDFTSFGILPFLQEKLNRLLLPDDMNGTTAPDYNVLPTHDQRTLLSVLNSEHSLIHRGPAQSGKSLALIAYALNHSLSKVPNFGAMKNTKFQQFIDSIILVPTDLLIGKYEYHTHNLTKDIPEICCPDQLVAEINQNDTYSVTRKPLTVKYLYSDGTCNTLCTSKSPEYHSDIPQILITTPSKLYDIMNDKLSVSDIKKESLNELRFFAVDEMDFLLNSTSINNNSNLIKSGKKSKYINKIEKIVGELQASQVEYYSSNLSRRLRYVETAHRNINRESFANNKFDHAKFVLEDNALSTSDVSIHIEHLFENTPIDKRPDESLLKKLIKAKRKVLYKPIQYCFIFHPKHSYHQILLQMSNKKYRKSFDRSIMQELQKIHNFSKLDDKLQQEYNKYLLEKITRNDERQEDSQVNFIEKIIRFDDSKRFYRKQERKIVSVGSFNLEANEKAFVRNENLDNVPSDSVNKICTHFIEAVNNKKHSGQVLLRDINITKNLPEKAGKISLLDNDVKISGYNIKNLLKSFLKFRMLSNAAQIMKGKTYTDIQGSTLKIIKKCVLKFRSEYPLNTYPVLIIVPPFINLEKIANKLNKSELSLDKFSCLSTDEFITKTENAPGASVFDYNSLRAFFLKQPPKENDRRTNLLVYPYQLIGQDFSGLTNMMVIGMESMLPQLALGSQDLNISDVTGIEEPLSDLAYFYLSKLSSSSSSEVKNFLFVLDAFNKNENKIFKSRIAGDFQRLSQIVLYNDLPENVNLTKFCDEQPSMEMNELIYGIDKSYMDKIKTAANRHVYK